MPEIPKKKHVILSIQNLESGAMSLATSGDHEHSYRRIILLRYDTKTVTNEEIKSNSVCICAWWCVD